MMAGQHRINDVSQAVFLPGIELPVALPLTEDMTSKMGGARWLKFCQPVGIQTQHTDEQAQLAEGRRMSEMIVGILAEGMAEGRPRSREVAEQQIGFGL